MNSASVLLEWKAEGKAEGFAEGMAAGMQEARRSDLLKILRMRFPDIASDITTGIRGMKDLDQMTRWLEVALTAPTMEMFGVMAHDADGRAGLRW
jgi:flagellar biosynthesis/type III secretory pathway protein FliH